MDVVFVILHYMTYSDTIACIESIKKYIDTEQYRIVVVDNASNNGSLEKLQKIYSVDQYVTLLTNESNVGFAQGLNVGIYYARETWNPEYVAAINNDTILFKYGFFSILRQKYEQYHYAVLGPMIITGDGRCNVNPIRNTLRNIQEVKKNINRYKKLITLCDFHLMWMYQFLKKRHSNNKTLTDMNICLRDQLDYKLHGAFWVFSKKYFDKFDGLDTCTFLYGEEDILYLHVIKNGLHTLYTPDIVVYHKEDSSTNQVLPKSNPKIRFVSENCIRSLEQYISIYQDYGE